MRPDVLRRAAFGLVALAVVLQAVPRAPDRHCNPANAEPTHHRHSAKDIAGLGQCPHCPPVECRRVGDCGAGSDWTVVAALATGVIPPAAGVEAGDDRFPPTRVQQPPTPPPQEHPVVA